MFWEGNHWATVLAEEFIRRGKSASGCGGGGYETQDKTVGASLLQIDMTVTIKFLPQSHLSSGHPSGPPPLQR
jgi:hypothetical protein